MQKGKSDHFVFYKNSSSSIILLVVYVDDIVITGSDSKGILSLKSFLHSQFHTKDLGMLKYFLSVEVMRSKQGIRLSQQKYVLNLLSKTGKLGAKPCSTPMTPNVQITKEGDLFEDPERYRRLVRKLNYLIGHTRIECFSDADWVRSNEDRRSTLGYYVFFRGNMISWKSKKQSVVSWSSADIEL